MSLYLLYHSLDGVYHDTSKHLLFDDIGSMLTIHCGTLSDTVDNSYYRWTKDGVFLQYMGDNYLSIANVLLNDTGEYICTLIHEQCELGSSTFQLDLERKCHLSHHIAIVI